jgi:hypothetical protein
VGFTWGGGAVVAVVAGVAGVAVVAVVGDEDDIATNNSRFPFFNYLTSNTDTVYCRRGEYATIKDDSLSGLLSTFQCSGSRLIIC